MIFSEKCVIISRYYEILCISIHIIAGIRIFRRIVMPDKGECKMSVFMKNIRRSAAVLLASACVLSFSGCDEEPEETVPTKTVPMTNEIGEVMTDEEGVTLMTEVPLETIVVTDDSGAPVTDESGETVYEYEKLPEEEKIVYKVAFVYSGYVEDGATNASFEVARAQIGKTLGLETAYMENVLVSDFPEAVNTLKDDGYNIIVACSPKYGNSAAKEARASHNTYFLAFGGDSQSGAISSFGGELYQTASVCGLAAAHNTKSNVIGVVADPGSYNVYGVVDAFVLGAAEIWSAHTDVRLNWAWSNSHEEIEAAVDDLIAQNCDIIMSYMESDYAVRYCEQKGVKVLGNCYNMPEIAPNNYISGYFFNFSTFLVDEVRSIINDNFNPRIYEGDVASGMARLVTFNNNVENGTEDICKKLYDYIKDGKAHTFMGEIKNTDGKIMLEKGQVMSFGNILKLNWLVQGIRKSASFTEIIDEPVGSDFLIHKTLPEIVTAETTAAADTTQPPEESETTVSE